MSACSCHGRIADLQSSVETSGYPADVRLMSHRPGDGVIFLYSWMAVTTWCSRKRNKVARRVSSSPPATHPLTSVKVHPAALRGVIAGDYHPRRAGLRACVLRGTPTPRLIRCFPSLSQSALKCKVLKITPFKRCPVRNPSFTAQGLVPGCSLSIRQRSQLERL